jgi:hypothetical protein
MRLPGTVGVRHGRRIAIGGMENAECGMRNDECEMRNEK